LKNYSLYDWLESSSFINKVYRETYSPGTCKKSLQQAQREHYPVVVSLATLRPYTYAKLARIISPAGFVAGMVTKPKFFQVRQKLAYKNLDAGLYRNGINKPATNHITDFYAQLMEQLFGVVVPCEKRAPFIEVPRQWITFAKLRFLKWSIDKKHKEFGKVFFINAFAKGTKRCWPLHYLLMLMIELKHQDQWGDVSFIVNVPPEEYHVVHNYFTQHSVNDMYLFSAQHNFFQLPAIISICDAVISVETSVMHLASALKVPVVALMRTKNPEWRPWDETRSVIVYAPNRQSWVKDITPQQVLEGVRMLIQRHFI
jgi:ADP-heptose:LPS heptosyltransferase